MKILLTAVNAKYIHSNLAVYSLRSYAKANRASIEIAEFTINHQKESVLRELYKRQADVLCFSCYIWNYEFVRKVAAEYHKLNPDVPIWVGGPEVSFEIEELFHKNPAFFGVMIGEGEATFAELTDYYCGNNEKNLSDIAGIAYRDKKNHIIQTAVREPLSMNEIPFCYEDTAEFENRIIYYESSRGCPFSCSYCLSSIDKKLRFRDTALVRQELSFFIRQKVPQVKFVDRTFNCSHDHAMAVWQFLKESDNGITNFHFEIAADLFCQEELILLSSLRPGLIQLEIGVQSTNPKTIQSIHRKMEFDKIVSAVQQIQRAGNIHVHLDLIAGLPFENYERFAQSFRDLYALKPNQLQLGFLKVLKGSYLYEKREEYGILYGDEPPYEALCTKWISYGEILSIKLVEEMLEVYYNSGQYEVTMKLIDVCYPDSFGFFLALGQFYEKEGYLERSHSRMKRCEILLEFLENDGRISTELMKEALLYDLYYRENMKSRPFWAVNPSQFAKETKLLCPNGKLSHVEPFYYHFPAKEEKTIKQLPERLLEAVYVLFEYEKRDVLSHQAKTTEYTSQEIKERWKNVPKKS